MSRYFIIDAAGYITSTIYTQSIEDLAANTPVDSTVMLEQDGINSLTHRLNRLTNQFELIPQDIEKVRTAKLAKIDKARLDEEEGGCNVVLNGQPGRIQTDFYSKLRISGAVQMALLAQLAGLPFSVEWRMEDNSDVLLEGPEMINMGVAVGNQTALAFEKSKLLKAEILAATTIAQINAVEWF